MVGRNVRMGAVLLLWTVAGVILALHAALQYTVIRAPATNSGGPSGALRGASARTAARQVESNTALKAYNNRFGQYDSGYDKSSAPGKGAVTGGVLAAGLALGVTSSPTLPGIAVLLVAAVSIGLIGRDVAAGGGLRGGFGKIPQAAGVFILAGLALVLATGGSPFAALIAAGLTAVISVYAATNGGGAQSSSFTGSFTLPRNTVSSGTTKQYSAPASRPSWIPRPGSSVSSLYSWSSGVSRPNWEPGRLNMANWKIGNWFDR